MATRTWDADTNNSWLTATNWSDNSKPVTTDVVIFDNTADDSCNADENVPLTGAFASLTVTADYDGDIDLVTFDLNVTGSITLAGSSAFNLGSGTHAIDGDFDCSGIGSLTGGSGDINVVGDVTLDGTVDFVDGDWTVGGDFDATSATLDLDLGSGTHEISGSFDYSTINSLDDGTSKIVMTGGTVGTPVDLVVKNSVQLHDFTIAADAFVDMTGGGSTVLVTGDLVVNGTLDITVGKTLSSVVGGSTATVGPNGKLTGAGLYTIGTPDTGEGIVLSPTSVCDPSLITVSRPFAGCLAPLGPGTYGSDDTATAIEIASTAAGHVHNFPDGDFTFRGPVTYETKAGAPDALEISNGATNFIFYDDLTLAQPADSTFTYTKGTGVITFVASATLTTISQGMEAVVVSGGTLTLADNLACDGFSVSSGATFDSGSNDLTTLNNGSIILSSGSAVTLASLNGTTWTVGGGVLDMQGTNSALLDLEVPGGAPFLVDNTGTNTARYCIMKDFALTPPQTGIAWNCVDEAGDPLTGTGTNGNTGWTFKTSTKNSSWGSNRLYWHRRMVPIN